MIRKPQGQIEVDATSNIARGDGKQVLQVISPESFARRQVSNREKRSYTQEYVKLTEFCCIVVCR